MSSRTVVIAEAEDEVQAGIWVDALRNAGVQAATFERGVGGALGGAVTGLAVYPVIVRESDFSAARNVIADLGDADRLSAYREPAADRARAARALALAAGVAVVALLAGVVASILRG